VSQEQLIAIFEFKANVLLQKTGLALSMKLGEKDPIDAWNDTQVFFI